MDKDLQAKIEKAIRDDLPQQVGDVLQARLGEVVALENRIEDLQVQLEVAGDNCTQLQRNFNNQKKKVEKLNSQLELAGDLDAKAEVLCTQAGRLRERELEIKLGAERRISSTMVTVLETLVRNPVVKRAVLNRIEDRATGEHYDPATGKTFYNQTPMVTETEVEETVE